MSTPASSQRRIWSIVARTSSVGVLVIVCTVTGASPPTGTLPTMIWRLGRRAMSRHGRMDMGGPIRLPCGNRKSLAGQRRCRYGRGHDAMDADHPRRLRPDRARHAVGDRRRRRARRAGPRARCRRRGARAGRRGARRGRGGDRGARGRSALQRRARRGAVAARARIELDAAIMDGATRAAGAVARRHAHAQPGRARPRGDGARARTCCSRATAPTPSPRSTGWSRSTPDWFDTARAPRASSTNCWPSGGDAFDVDMKYGTVGAVACDSARPCRRGDLDRRGHRQALGPDRRFAADRRGHLGRRSRLRGLGDRGGRVFHPRRRRRTRSPRACGCSGEDVGTAADAVLADITALGGTGGRDRRRARRARRRGASPRRACTAPPSPPTASAKIAIYGDEA